MPDAPTPARSRQQQMDIHAILGAMDELASIAIVREQRGDTIAMMEKALAGTFKAGKLPGASIVVQMPDEEPEEKFSQALSEVRTIIVSVIEKVMENRPQDGGDTPRCGYTADELKDLVKQCLHDRPLGTALLKWKGTKSFTDGHGGIGYLISFLLVDSLPTIARGAEPLIAFSGGDCTLTGGGHAGEQIFYTTDGSTPVPGGATVRTYSAAFAAAAGTLVRAASTATDRALSGITQEEAA